MKNSAKRFGLENYQHPDKFGEWLGYRVSKIDRKNHIATATLKIREDHLSPAARVHGGVVAAFIDFSFGAAVFSTLGPKDLCSTVEIKVNYLRPVHLGDYLRAEARVIFRGSRLCVLEAFVFKKGHREPISMATATFNVKTAQPESPSRKSRDQKA